MARKQNIIRFSVKISKLSGLLWRPGHGIYHLIYGQVIIGKVSHLRNIKKMQSIRI